MKFFIFLFFLIFENSKKFKKKFQKNHIYIFGIKNLYLIFLHEIRFQA
jgi:hypothetical protein